MVVAQLCARMRCQVRLSASCFFSVPTHSVTGVVKYLYDHPEGLDPPINARNIPDMNNHKEFSTVVAKKGDVILLHGLLPHTASPNFLHYARVISNPHVSLHSPYNLNREDGNYVSS